MSERRGFVTAGTWCLDRNITVDFWPQEDMLATVLDVKLSGGGAACNFASSMRKLDPSTPVETMGLLSSDGHGDYLQSVASDAGMRHRFVRTGEAATQTTDAYVSAKTGRRTHIAYLGTAPLLSPDHFDFTATQALLLHLGLPGIHRIMDAPWEGDPNGWVTTLRKARIHGLETNLEPVSVAPALVRELLLPCLPHLTTLVLNDFELGAIAAMETVGETGTDETACERAALKVLGLGAMDVVVVHYPMGALLVSRGGDSLRVASVMVPPDMINGSNGAGDAFAAGFHYGRQSGWPPGDCVRLAHATAAACLRAPDPASAIETAQDCLSLAEQLGWRD